MVQGGTDSAFHGSESARIPFSSAFSPLEIDHVESISCRVEAKLFETLRGGTVLASSTQLLFSRSVEDQRRRAGGSEDMHGASRVSALITRKHPGAGLSRTVCCLRALHPQANKFQSIVMAEKNEAYQRGVVTVASGRNW